MLEIGYIFASKPFSILFLQNWQTTRQDVIKEQDSVNLDGRDPHVRLKLVECGDVELNPGPQSQVGTFYVCMRYCFYKRSMLKCVKTYVVSTELC